MMTNTPRHHYWFIAGLGITLALLLGLSSLGNYVDAEDEATPAAVTEELAGRGLSVQPAPTFVLPTLAATLPTFTPLPTLTPTPLPSATPIPPTPLPPTPLPPTNTAVPPPPPTAVPSPTAIPPLPTPDSGFEWRFAVPILMYHYISTPPADADIYRLDLSVTPEQFREQMQYLADNGYTPIDLYDLSRVLANKQTLPPRPVILTFDDGYLDAYTNAFPILQEFGFKGTFFIITELVDKEHPSYMSWAMIEEMAAAGHRMEVHTKTHPDLRGQSHDFLIWEILGSQQTLEAHIGYTPRYFCYPGGWYDAATIDVLRALDFWGAVTTAGGEWHSFEGRYEWTRLRIRNTTTIEHFAELVATE